MISRRHILSSKMFFKEFQDFWAVVSHDVNFGFKHNYCVSESSFLMYSDLEPRNQEPRKSLFSSTFFEVFYNHCLIISSSFNQPNLKIPNLNWLFQVKSNFQKVVDASPSKLIFLSCCQKDLVQNLILKLLPFLK